MSFKDTWEVNENGEKFVFTVEMFNPISNFIKVNLYMIKRLSNLFTKQIDLFFLFKKSKHLTLK